MLENEIMNESNPESENELWSEIPKTAFIALGTRGVESISLDQCFSPNCNSEDIKKLHPIKKETESTSSKDGSGEIQHIKYTMHCDSCQQDFKLIFERCVNKEKINPDHPDAEIILERVYATDLNENSYGEIGWVQDKSR
jgi:hypothetical protein